jgi:hypothetical protein
MTFDKSSQLFFCCKIDSKLAEALEQAKPGDKRYFEDADSEFLQILEIDLGEKRERWIGKVTKAGLNVTEAEDIQRNVVSILRRIATGVRIAPSSVKIYAITSPEVAGDPEPESGGPYIADY